MTTLKVKLTPEQFKALEEHASKKGRPVEEDIVAVWWGRTQALLTYAERQEGKVERPKKEKRGKRDEATVERKHAPEQGPLQGRAKRPAPPPSKKETLKEVRILPDDSPEEACRKADAIEDAGSELTGAEILKKFGRDIKGRKL